MHKLLPGLDHIANFINSFDTEGIGVLEFRKVIYHECISPNLIDKTSCNLYKEIEGDKNMDKPHDTLALLTPLEPCPSGHEGVRLSRCFTNFGEKWYGNCTSCNWSGPLETTTAGAIAAWNTRTPDLVARCAALEAEIYKIMRTAEMSAGIALKTRAILARPAL